MAGEEHEDKEVASSSGRFQIPVTITFRDMVVVILTVISLVTAWGVYGTRLTLVEEKEVTINNSIDDVKQDLKDQKQEDRTEHGAIRINIGDLDQRVRRLEEAQARMDGILRNHPRNR